MCNFHHIYIKKKYNDKTKLLFTDTDSLITYEIETKDVYKDFWSDKDINSIIANIQKTPHTLVNQTKQLLESSKIKYQEFQLLIMSS